MRDVFLRACLFVPFLCSCFFLRDSFKLELILAPEELGGKNLSVVGSCARKNNQPRNGKWEHKDGQYPLVYATGWCLLLFRARLNWEIEADPSLNSIPLYTLKFSNNHRERNVWLPCLMIGLVAVVHLIFGSSPFNNMDNISSFST